MQPRHSPAASQQQHSQQYGTRDSPRQGFNTRYERSAYKLFPAQAHYQRPPTPESLIQRNPNLQRSAGFATSSNIANRSRRSNSFDEGKRNKMLPSPRLQTTSIENYPASSSSTPQLQQIQNEILRSDETRMSSAWQNIVRAKPDHVSALISQFNETKVAPNAQSAQDHGRGRSESAPLRQDASTAHRQEMNQKASKDNENTVLESVEASRTSQIQKLHAAGLQAPGGDGDFSTSSPMSSSPRGMMAQQQRFTQSSRESPHSSVAPYGLGLNFDSNRTTPDLSMFPAPGFQHSTPLVGSPVRSASPNSYPFPRPHSPQSTPRPHSPHSVPRPHSPHGVSNMRQPSSPHGYQSRSPAPIPLQSPRIRSPLHDEGRADSPIYTPPNFTSKKRFDHALRVNTAVTSTVRPMHAAQQQQEPRLRSMSQPQIKPQSQSLPPQRRSPPQPQHSSPEIQQMRNRSPEVQQQQFNRPSPQQSRIVPEQNQKPQGNVETPAENEEVSTSAESESKPKAIRKSALQKPLPPPPPESTSMPSTHSAEDSSESSKQSPNRRSPESEPVTLSPVSPVSPISPDSRAIHHQTTRTPRGNGLGSPVSAISKASMETTREAIAADAPSVPPLPKTVSRKPVAKSPPTQFTNSPESPLHPPPTSRFQVRVSSPGRRPSAMDDSPAEAMSPEPNSGSVRSPDLNDSPVRVENARSVVIVGGSAENGTPGHRKNTSVVLTPSVITISENSRSSASGSSVRPDSSSQPGTPVKFQNAALVSTPSRPTSEKLQNISEKQEDGVEQRAAESARSVKVAPDVKRAELVDTAKSPSAAPVSRVPATKPNVESKPQSSGLSNVLTLEASPSLSSMINESGRNTPRNEVLSEAENRSMSSDRSEIISKPELRSTQTAAAEATRQLESISERRTDPTSQSELQPADKASERKAPASSSVNNDSTSATNKNEEADRLAYSARSIFERAKAAAAAATAAYAAENAKPTAESQSVNAQASKVAIEDAKPAADSQSASAQAARVTTQPKISPTKAATQPASTEKKASPQSPTTVEASELALRLAAAEKMHFASQAIMTPEKANTVLQQMTSEQLNTPAEVSDTSKESLPVQVTARKDSLAAQPVNASEKSVTQAAVRKESLTSLPVAKDERISAQPAVRNESLPVQSKNVEKPVSNSSAISDKSQVQAQKTVEPLKQPSQMTALPQAVAETALEQPKTSSNATSQAKHAQLTPEKKLDTVSDAKLQPPAPQSRAVSAVSPVTSPSSTTSDRPKPQNTPSYKKFFMQEDVFFAQPMVPSASVEEKKESGIAEVEQELSVEDLPRPRLSMRRSASPASSHRTELPPVIEEESPEVAQAAFPAPTKPIEITHVRTDSAALRTRRIDSLEHSPSINTPDTPAEFEVKKEEPRQIQQQPISQPVEAVESPKPSRLIDNIPPATKERPTSANKRPKTPKTFEPTTRTFDDIIGSDSPRNRGAFRPGAILQSVGKFARLANNNNQASNTPNGSRQNADSRPTTPALDVLPLDPPPADALARFADRDERSPRPRDSSPRPRNSSPRPRGSDPVLSAALTSNPPNEIMTRDGPVTRERGSLTGEAVPATARQAESKISAEKPVDKPVDKPVEKPVKPRVVSDLPPPVPRKDTVRIQRKAINVVDESPIIPPTASAIPPATASSLRGESRGSDVSSKADHQETSHTRESSDRSANSSIDLKAIRARVAGISQRTAKAVEAPAKDEESLLAALEELNKTSESLHDRYADLKMERVKLSAAFLASLKDRNQGPEHTESILAQHAALASIASSMDICFAKLKSVDCQKEESITALRSQLRRKPSSSSVRTGRASSKTRQVGIIPSRGPSDATTAVDRSDSLDKTKLDNAAAQAKLNVNSDESSKRVQTEAQKTAGSPKKDTARDDPNPKKREEVKQDEVEAEEEAKRRIKGVKAAKVLGLADEKDITLPDTLDKTDTSRLVVTVGPAKQAKATAGPAPQRPLPAAPKRRSIVDSVHASMMSFATTPSDQDNWTPSEEMVVPNALKGPVTGRDVRVYADDDLLEYYHNAP